MNELNREEIRFLIDVMTWSFSRMNFNCLFEWKRHYIEGEHQQGNFYAEFGGLVHKCLEIYLQGILPIDQIVEYYDSNFDDYCKSDFDPERREQYYNQGYEYLKDIPKYLPLDKYNIIGVEKELSFVLREDREGYEPREYPMTGFIDLLLENKETGGLVFTDHKSSGMRFSKKTGLPYKNDEEHFKAFVRQQMLYTVPYVEAGKKIEALQWNMFRTKYIKKIYWTREAYDEAYYWALDQIHLLENEENWLPKQDYFYCQNLCGYRNNCIDSLEVKNWFEQI